MPASVTTRRAVDADLAAIRAILAAHGDDGPLAPGAADVVGPYLVHLLTRHTVLVADEAGIVIAFGAVLDTGSSVQLADLFVRPDRLGQGLGGRLLAALFGDVPLRTLAGLGRAGRGGPVQACVPGPNPILPVLLGAGFRVVDQDQFMASRPDLADPARLLPNPGML